MLPLGIVSRRESPPVPLARVAYYKRPNTLGSAQVLASFSKDNFDRVVATARQAIRRHWLETMLSLVSVDR